MALNTEVIEQAYTLLESVNQSLTGLITRRDAVYGLVGSQPDPETGAQTRPGWHADPDLEISNANGVAALQRLRDEMATIATDLATLLSGT